MPFKFSYLCHLFEDLEKHELASQKESKQNKDIKIRKTINIWFDKHRTAIDSRSTDRTALLSCLFPERRTDRVYGLRARALLTVLSKNLGLGPQRDNELRSWKDVGSGDLGAWTCKIVRVTDDGTSSSFTLETIDAALEQIAARSRFSSPHVRAKRCGNPDHGVHEYLGPIIRCLPSQELKWFIRLVLKDFASITLDENHVLERVHFLLPRLLRVQSTFEAAVHMLSGPLMQNLPTTVGSEISTPIRLDCLRPLVGVKVGRPNYIKARSIKHCLEITRNSKWSVESKIDGEYVQIHVDLSKGEDCLQLWAKSGKDATEDRRKTHSWIKKCLKIGTEDCGFKRECILEGEMVVRNNQDQSILEFSKIRQHISRSGAFLGSKLEFQPRANEELIVIFYDALLIDDEITMALPYDLRRARLSKLLKSASKGEERPALLNLLPETNRSNYGVLDFKKLSAAKAAYKLSNYLADAIANRCEGLVLKPCDASYLSIDDSSSNGGKMIKLKKDYIAGLGDSLDFAIIGAARQVNAASVRDSKWTHFVLACLENKEEIVRFQRKPKYRIVDSLMKEMVPARYLGQVMEHIQRYSISAAPGTESSTLEVLHSRLDPQVDIWLTKPIIVEVLGSGFDRRPGYTFYTLRHPRLTKVHSDRGLEDVVSFSELEEVAETCTKLPKDIGQDEAAWLDRITAQFKPDHRFYACSRSPYSETTSTSGYSADFASLDQITRLKSPVMVRMDSMEMTVDDDRLVPAESGSSASRYCFPEASCATSACNVGIKIPEPDNAIRIFAGSPASSTTRGSCDPETASRVLAEVENCTPRHARHAGPFEIDTMMNSIQVDYQRVQYNAPASTDRPIGRDNHATHAHSSGDKRKMSNDDASVITTKRIKVDFNSSPLLTKGSIILSTLATHQPSISHFGSTGSITLPTRTSPVRPAYRDRSSSVSSDLSTTEGTESGYITAPSSPIISPPKFIGSQSLPSSTSHAIIRAGSFDNPFQNISVFIPPSMSTHMYLNQILLPLLKTKRAYVTKNISNWIREVHPPKPSPPRYQSDFHPDNAFTSPPPTPLRPIASSTLLDHSSENHLQHDKFTPALPKTPEQPRTRKTIIPESPSLPSHQKIMLIEPCAPSQAKAEIKTLINKIDLMYEEGEKIEIWDWRVLERLLPSYDSVNQREPRAVGNEAYEYTRTRTTNTKNRPTSVKEATIIDTNTREWKDYKVGVVSWDWKEERNRFVPSLARHDLDFM